MIVGGQRAAALIDDDAWLFSTHSPHRSRLRV
jgi:hypothetical protein